MSDTVPNPEHGMKEPEEVTDSEELNEEDLDAAAGGLGVFPDVCKTPTPAGPIPIPYPNTAVPGDAPLQAARTTRSAQTRKPT